MIKKYCKTKCYILSHLCMHGITLDSSISCLENNKSKKKNERSARISSRCTPHFFSECMLEIFANLFF